MTPTELNAIRARDSIEDMFVGGSVHAQALFEDAHADRRALLAEREAFAAKLNLANEAYVGMNKLWLDEMKFRCSVEIKRDALLAEVQSLQRALAFWMPRVPAGESPAIDRLANDAWLLSGYEGEDEPDAESMGWVVLNTLAKEPTT